MDMKTIGRVWLPMIAGLYALIAIFRVGHGPSVARWIGLVLGLIGLSGVIVARYTLGRSFSVRPQARAMVTNGIYSRVRNPIYIFGGICVTGAGVMLWSPYLLIILAVMIPMQIVRARKEAAVLEAKFGDEYREYREKTWF